MYTKQRSLDTVKLLLENLFYLANKSQLKEPIDKLEYVYTIDLTLGEIIKIWHTEVKSYNNFPYFGSFTAALNAKKACKFLCDDLYGNDNKPKSKKCN